MTDLQTSAKIDWLDEFQAGSGVVAPSGQLMRCAIDGFNLPPLDDAINHFFKASMVDSQEKVAQLVDASASGGFNAWGVEGKFSAAWRNELSYGSRQCTMLLQATVDWRPQIAPTRDLRLTAEARKLLEKGADKFRRAYGDYFIAGYQRRAAFYVVYKLEARDETSMMNFKAEAQASGYKAFGQASAELQKTAQKHGISIDCVRIQQGVSGKAPMAATLQPEDVLKSYETFVEHVVGEPSAAILYHYSMVDPDVPSTVEVSPEILVGARMLHFRLLDCTAAMRGVPEAYRGALAEELIRLRADIEAHVPRNLDCPVKTMERLAAAVDNWCSRYAEVQMYAQIWTALKAETKTAPRSGNNAATGMTYWKAGIIRGTHEGAAVAAEQPRFPGQVNPAPEVIEVFNQRYGIDWHVGHREWRPVVSKPKFRICGYEVQANRGDNGSWVVTDGGLMQDRIAFQFYSCYDRGMDWTVRVWGIPAEHLGFDTQTPRAAVVMLKLAASTDEAGTAPKKAPAHAAHRRRAKAA